MRLSTTLRRRSGNVGKRPVDALVGGTSVSEASAAVQTDGVVLRGSHVLEVKALLCSACKLGECERISAFVVLTGARQLDGDTAVSHGVPLLAVRGVGALVNGDVRHVLPVGYSIRRIRLNGFRVWSL